MAANKRAHDTWLWIPIMPAEALTPRNLGHLSHFSEPRDFAIWGLARVSKILDFPYPEPVVSLDNVIFKENIWNDYRGRRGQMAGKEWLLEFLFWKFRTEMCFYFILYLDRYLGQETFISDHLEGDELLARYFWGSENGKTHFAFVLPTRSLESDLNSWGHSLPAVSILTVALKSNVSALKNNISKLISVPSLLCSRF